MRIKTILFKFTFISLMALQLMACNAQNAPAPVIPQELLVVSEYTLRIEKTENLQLIDVRTPNEFNQGHIQHAINIDFYNPDFMQEMEKLNKLKPVYIYCRSGNRSGKASNMLSSKGFRSVIDLKGGYMAWRQHSM